MKKNNLLKILSFDFNRSLTGYGFKVSLFISIIISMIHIIINILPIYKEGWIFPISLFSKWIGGENFSFPSQLLFLIFPIISTLPYGDSYFQDKKTGYLKQLYIRAKKSHILLSKYIVTLVMGMIAVIVPLVMNLLVTALIYPSLYPQPSTMMFSPTLFGFLCELFFENPWAYCLIYILIISLFFGFIGCMGLACGAIFKHKVTVLGAPFIAYLAICIFASLFNINNPQLIFHPTQFERASAMILFSYIIAPCFFSIILFFGRGLTSETY